MNERIEQLISRANEDLDGVTPGSQPMIDPSFDQFIKKFAELIVLECAKIGSKAMYPDSDPDYVGRKIKQHFGVEELQ